MSGTRDMRRQAEHGQISTGGMMFDRDLTQRVHALFAGRRPLDPDVNFFEAGFSSAMLAELLPALRELGLSVTLTDLYRYPTVRQLAAAGRPAPVARPPWLRESAAAPERTDGDAER